MELRDWLIDVARHNGATGPSVKHYSGFASHIRKDFPRFAFNPDTARTVGTSIGGRFPTWDELRHAIRATLTDATTTPSRDPAPRVLTEAEREAEADRHDREWWTARIDAIAKLRHAIEAHRAACVMLETLTRPPGTMAPNDKGALPRPYAIERLRRIRDTTREAMERPA